jgi:hypothetical protein
MAQLSPPTPAVVDLRTGASISLARFTTFDLAFARDEPQEIRSEYHDLIGPNIGAVMARVGWRWAGSSVRVDAWLPGAGGSDGIEPRIVASGWASPIQAEENGSCGINISYGVGAAHRRSGFGRLLAYCAVAECLANQALSGAAIPAFVNIQARASNEASLAVARSLGLPACPSAGFTVPENGGRIDYVGFREPLRDFLARGLPPTRNRLPSYDPGSLAASRLGLIEGSSSDLDLLGWLNDFTVEADIDPYGRDDEPERLHPTPV